MEQNKVEVQTRHLHIAILTQGTVRWELANYLLQLVNTKADGLALEHSRPFSVVFYEGRSLQGRPVSSNRNRIVRDRPPGSDLIMIDGDVIPHFEMFEIALQTDKDIIICPTPIWRAADNNACPVRVNLNAKEDHKVIALGADQYDEVLDGGTGAIYVSAQVLDHPGMAHPFRFTPGDDGVTIYGEDYYFCDKARELGFKIYAANKMLCGHMQEVNLLTVMRRFYNVMELAEMEEELAQP